MLEEQILFVAGLTAVSVVFVGRALGDVQEMKSAAGAINVQYDLPILKMDQGCSIATCKKQGTCTPVACMPTQIHNEPLKI